MPQDKLTAVRIKQQNGQYGPQIPVGAKAENVKYDNMYSVKEVLGNVKTNVGPLQEQIDNIDTEAIAGAVDEWLDEHAATTVVIDDDLVMQGAAADAKQAGKVVTVNNETDGNATKLHLNTTNDTVSVLTTDDIDTTLSISGTVADAKATGDRFDDLETQIIDSAGLEFSAKASFASATSKRFAIQYFALPIIQANKKYIFIVDGSVTDADLWYVTITSEQNLNSGSIVKAIQPSTNTSGQYIYEIILTDEEAAQALYLALYVNAANAVEIKVYILDGIETFILNYSAASVVKGVEIMPIMPGVGVSFNGTTAILDLHSYFYIRNTSNTGNSYYTVPCNPTYTIENGQGLFVDIDNKTILVLNLTTRIIDSKYSLLIANQYGFLKGPWAQYCYKDILDNKFNSFKNNINLYAYSNETTLDKDSSNVLYDMITGLNILQGETIYVYLDLGGAAIVSGKAIQIRANEKFVVSLNTSQTDKWVAITLGGNLSQGEIITKIGVEFAAGVISADTTGILYIASEISKDFQDIKKDIADHDVQINNKIDSIELDKESIDTTFSTGIENVFPNMITGLNLPYGSKFYIRIAHTSVENPLNSGSAIQVRANNKYIMSLNRGQLNSWQEIILEGSLSQGEVTNSIGLIANSSAMAVTVDLKLQIKSKIYKEINILSEAIEKIENPLPEYYTNEWKNTTIKNVQDQLGSLKTGVSFAFITDMHMSVNALNSGNILKMLHDNTPLDFVIYGGDTVKATGAKSIMDNDILLWNKFASQTGMEIYPVRGNHDFTIKFTSSGNTGYTYFNSFARAQVMNKISRKVIGDTENCYYYFDDTINKVRYIVIDEWFKNLADEENNNNIPWGVEDGMAENNSIKQYNFLKNALNINDYTIIIFTHSKPYISETSALHQFIKAFKNKTQKVYGNTSGTILYNVDFTNNTSDLACVISGHIHMDRSAVEDNVLYIETTCDAYFADDAADRTLGTVNEQAIDIFSIDTTNKTIYAGRVGGGITTYRNWTY